MLGPNYWQNHSVIARSIEKDASCTGKCTAKSYSAVPIMQHVRQDHSSPLHLLHCQRTVTSREKCPFERALLHGSGKCVSTCLPSTTLSVQVRLTLKALTKKTRSL